MSYFFRKLEKIRQNLSSAAVVIGALRVKSAAGTMSVKNEHNYFLHIVKVQKYISILCNLCN